MNKHIVDYLNYYINIENPQYAILINGSWGSGKTFFIKEQLKTWEEEKDDSQETITLQPIYVSLNGISTIKQINEKIRAEISPILHSKGMKVAKNIFKGFLKTAIKIDIDFDNNDKSDGNLSFNLDSLDIFNSSNDKIKGKKILIFDDIERCKIDTDEIFGFINYYVEHLSCKVILLSDENKIKLKYNDSESKIKYKDFKEKLIGQTFYIESDIDSAISYFFKQTKQRNKNLDLDSHKELIIHLFKTSKLENLRVLKQAILDFSRIISKINTQTKEHDNYDEFLVNFLAYFIIVYAELKTGNNQYKEFKKTFSLLDEDNTSENSLNTKYKEIFSEYNIYDSTYTFPIIELYNYIENGHIEKDKLNQLINSNAFFRKDEQEDWEKLWYWYELEDKEFKLLSKSVWSLFVSEKINNISVLIHITGIFLKLINENIISKEKSYVLKKAKRISMKIFKKGNIPAQYSLFGFMNSSHGKQYHSNETEEFKLLKNYIESLVIKNQSNKTKSYLKDYFENINEDSIKNIYSILKEITPESNTTYENTAIFEYVNGKKLGEKIKLLSNKSLLSFKHFLHSRYYPEEKYTNVSLQSYHKNDIKCLSELIIILKKNIKKRDLIKNKIISLFSNDLENIIIKLNKL
ncbi:P-loop NTPase fold protein [Wenyingzhuangia sp. chi5]|uniref:P-loop NTPase fold protein n=1 Tax=Wenyingzhuangia gilva TaxID=3057677 RepID=A0ABT8VVN8_9FLAO|nr:P-loop NTPase fold protein [Wenyingzhuangia sp. chi5]MDO3695995.1 P-loop NTPase fold protein [Wenyingzhuangia sp. chi5]